MKLNVAELHPGEPTDVTFAKQAHYFMSKYDYKNALFYVNMALEINTESIVSPKSALSKHSYVHAIFFKGWALSTDIKYTYNVV